MVKQILKFLLTLFLVAASLSDAFCQSPSPIWVNDIGGQGDSKPTGMVTDSQNNIYISGYFNGTVDFDPSSGVKNLTSNGDYDIYVAKYTASGTLIWAESMGGSLLDQVNCMSIDKDGNFTITGQYQSPVFDADPGPGVSNLTGNGGDDIFVIHMDTNGKFLWAKSIGGPDTDRGEQVSADIQDNVIITSIFQSTINVEGHQLNAMGGFNGLIVKYDPNGNLLWVVNLGQTNDNEVFGNRTDSSGNIVVSGSFSGVVNFNPLGTPHMVTSTGLNNPFVAKYTPLGQLIWVETVTGNLVYNQSVISIDSQDNIFLTGAYNAPLTFNGNTTINPVGSADMFLAKYSSTGTFQFTKAIGGTYATGYVYQMVCDKTNDVYLTGYFNGTLDFNPSPSVAANLTDHGQRDFFVSKFDGNGNYQWAFNGGSAACNNTFGIELSVDQNNAVILGGAFCQTVDFDPSTCINDNVTAQNGTSDSFIAKYIQSTTSTPQITAFVIQQQSAPAVIDQINHTIAVTVIAGTAVTNLAPSISVSNGGTISPAPDVSQDFTQPKVYTVTANCVSVPYTVTVTVGTLLKSDTTCVGASHLLTGDAIIPLPDIYTWQILLNNSWINAPGGFNLKDYQTSVLTNATVSNITYSLRRQTTITNGNVIKYDSFYNLVVQPVAAISNNTITQPLNSSFCINGDPGLIAGSLPTGGNGNYVYQWQSSTDNIKFADIAGATAADYAPGVVSNSVIFRRKVTSGNCVVPAISNIITISIFSSLTNNTITPPNVSQFCSVGIPAAITGSTPSGGNGNYTYQWESSTDSLNFNNILGANASNYLPGSLTTTTYYRRLVTSAACSTPAISNIVSIHIVSPPTTPNPTKTTVDICYGAAVSISVLNPQSNLTYNWYDSPDKKNKVFTGNTFTINSLSTSAVFYVEAFSGACSSDAMASVQMNVIPLPATPSPVKSSIEICEGSSATLSVVNPVQTNTYNWYSSATNGVILYSGVDFSTSPVTTSAIYYVEAVNISGCASQSRSPVSIAVNLLPLVTTAGASVCPGSSAVLTASSSDPNSTINWYDKLTGGTVVFSGNSFQTPPINAPTTFYAEAVDQITGCISATRSLASIELTKPLPAPTVVVDSTSSSSVIFRWNSVPGAIGYQVSLDNGTTFTDPSSGSNGLSNEVAGLQRGQSVTLIVRAVGTQTCALSQSSVAVTGTSIDPLANLIYVPNAFTPNGDGKNDIVYVHSENIKSLKFYIYDQWGELLYTSGSQKNGWDGYYKGTKQPVGVYVYYLEAIMNSGLKVNKKGTITLLR